VSARARGFQLWRDHVIERKCELYAVALGALEQCLRGVHQIVFHERSSDRDALRLEERVRHRPAHQERLNAAEQVLDHLELVRDFCAAENRDKRMVGLFSASPR
jgi:hypothetical protein